MLRSSIDLPRLSVARDWESELARLTIVFETRVSIVIALAICRTLFDGGVVEF